MKRVIATLTIATVLFSFQHPTNPAADCRFVAQKTVAGKNVACFESFAKNDPFYFHLFSSIEMQATPHNKKNDHNNNLNKCKY